MFWIDMDDDGYRYYGRNYGRDRLESRTIDNYACNFSRKVDFNWSRLIFLVDAALLDKYGFNDGYQIDPEHAEILRRIGRNKAV